MYAYSVHQLKKILDDILKRNLNDDAWQWLVQHTSSDDSQSYGRRIAIAFVAAPGKTSRKPLDLTAGELAALSKERAGFDPANWTVDQLVRVWLLLQLDTANEQRYYTFINNLFLSAEMNEMVALYSSLPLLAFPERWEKRCAEGIRSNIGQVLEAVMCRNPYPSEQLDEGAWNQLVLKAIFTEKPLLEIVRLQERANASLAKSISDFAHERWAAQRQVSPLVWICVERFVDETIMADIRKLAASLNSHERKAAALVCAASDYQPARELLDKNSGIRAYLSDPDFSWKGLEKDMLSGAA
ncbi:MAG TPA: EboA domain-containing protein [Ohtaekwangia sp.]|nr:EboA domain-containing protein [Ohtaekwangia sp.]